MDPHVVEAAIKATRTARDNSAQAAHKARSIGIPTMGTELDQLAAAYDRLLANLLYLEDELRRAAGD